MPNLPRAVAMLEHWQRTQARVLAGESVTLPGNAKPMTADNAANIVRYWEAKLTRAREFAAERGLPEVPAPLAAATGTSTPLANAGEPGAAASRKPRGRPRKTATEKQE